MMYQDGSVSMNVKYQELCTDVFRKHSNKIKTDWNQWQEYTYIHKHNNNKQEILHR